MGNSISRFRVSNDIAGTVEAATNVPFDPVARVTPVTINAEIERAVIEFKHDEDLKKFLASMDDKTSYTGKYAGDTWYATARLMALIKDKDTYPVLNAAVPAARVKKGIYGPVLKALGMHRLQRLRRSEELKALAASKAAREAADSVAE